jgi:hypothetical protein
MFIHRGDGVRGGADDSRSLGGDLGHCWHRLKREVMSAYSLPPGITAKIIYCHEPECCILDIVFGAIPFHRKRGHSLKSLCICDGYL